MHLDPLTGYMDDFILMNFQDEINIRIKIFLFHGLELVFFLVKKKVLSNETINLYFLGHELAKVLTTETKTTTSLIQ